MLVAGSPPEEKKTNKHCAARLLAKLKPFALRGVIRHAAIATLTFSGVPAGESTEFRQKSRGGLRSSNHSP